MKSKRTILMAAAILTTVGAFAEPRLDTTEDMFVTEGHQPYWGVRLSVDLMCPGKEKVSGAELDAFKKGPGVTAGIVYNYPLFLNLYLEPGLQVYYNAFGMNIDTAEIGGSKVDNASVRNFGFRIPVTVGYKIGWEPMGNVAFFTGPMLDVGVTSDQHITFTEEGEKFHSSASSYGDNALMFKMRRVDLKWKFGIGVNFPNHTYIGLDGNVGIVNLAANIKKSLPEGVEYSHPTWRCSNVSLTLGYNF